MAALHGGIEPAKKEPGWEAASAVLDRWMKAQGLDRPAELVFPRSSSHEILVGDATRGTKLSFVKAAGAHYRLVVDHVDGTRYGEISEGSWGRWHMSVVTGIGRLTGKSDLVDTLERNRIDANFLRQNYRSWRLHPDETRDGKTCHVVGMVPNGSGYEFWWFDAETGLLNVIDSISPEQKVIGRVRFGDFRPTGDAVEPYEMTIGEGPQRITLKTSAIKNQVGVPEGFFAPTKEELNRWQKTEDILIKYVKACGGFGALSQVVTRVTQLSGENTATGAKFTVIVSQKSPSFYLSETLVEGLGRSWVGFDGENAWELSELKGFRTMKGSELQLFQRNGQLNTEYFPRTFPLRKMGDVGELVGTRVVTLELATPHAPAGTHYFDVETGQLLRVDSVVLTDGGGSLAVTIDFSDFRVVDGVTLPYRTVLKNPAMRVVMSVETVRQNVELPDALFRPRKEE